MYWIERRSAQRAWRTVRRRERRVESAMIRTYIIGTMPYMTVDDQVQSFYFQQEALLCERRWRMMGVLATALLYVVPF